MDCLTLATLLAAGSLAMFSQDITKQMVMMWFMLAELTTTAQQVIQQQKKLEWTHQSSSKL